MPTDKLIKEVSKQLVIEKALRKESSSSEEAPVVRKPSEGLSKKHIKRKE